MDTVQALEAQNARGFGDIGAPEDKAIKALMRKVEDLVDGRFDYSGRYANIFGIPHVTIVNGAIKPEGAPSVPWPGLDEACESTFQVAKRMRDAIDGKACLFWRAAPEVEREGEREQLRTRLSFAPFPDGC